MSMAEKNRNKANKTKEESRQSTDVRLRCQAVEVRDRLLTTAKGQGDPWKHYHHCLTRIVGIHVGESIFQKDKFVSIKSLGPVCTRIFARDHELH